MYRLLFLIPTLFLLAVGNGKSVFCPTVRDVKSGNLQGWFVLNTDNGEEISLSAFRDQAQNISSFELSAFYLGVPGGEAQCYYAGRGDSAFYLARAGLIPVLVYGDWIKTRFDFYDCNESIEMCFFKVK